MAKITRREIIKKALYVAPVILTLTAVPALVSSGSGNYVSDLAHIPHTSPNAVSDLAQTGPNAVSDLVSKGPK